MYIHSSVELDPQEFIGGRVADFSEELPITRAGDIFNYIYQYGRNYLVCYTFISLGHGRYELWQSPDFRDVSGLFESLSIKEGVDLIDHQTYLEVVAYYGTNRQYVYLYPISESKTEELFWKSETTDESFDYVVSDMIDADKEVLGTDDEHYILQNWA
jgi:hypothetical protein